MQRLLLIGLNHTTAPLEVREKLAFAPQQTLFALAELQKQIDHCEAVILCTCNRVELYLAAADKIEPRRVVDFLSHFHNLPSDLFDTHLYHLEGHDVVKHLFAVSSSLDSMVLGETQILGQVKHAYEVARSAGATGPLLNPLFQKASQVGKDVLSQTQLSDGRTSVASVAVDYAKQIFDRFDDKTVLCVGTGKMTQLVLQSFSELKTGKLLVCSRTQERANDIAALYHGQGVAFSEIDKYLVSGDIIITSTGAPHPIFTRKRFESLIRQRRYRPIFVIDIAVPRDVEAGVGDLDGVYLYNMDDLQDVVSKTCSTRTGSLDDARTIVGQYVEEFLGWHRQREIGPMIDSLYKRYHHLARQELNEATANMQLSADQRRQLEETVYRIVQKMLHDPVSQLKNSPNPHETGRAYLHAVEKLFKLDLPIQEILADEKLR